MALGSNALGSVALGAGAPVSTPSTPPNFTYTLPTITGSHTDFVVVLKTADFPASAIDGTTNAISNGGGDLVAYTDDTKTTQLPVEVVSFVSGGTPSAEVWIKIPTAATSNTIYIEKSATQTSQPAVTSTYGRNAVWVDYEGVFHLEEDPSGTAPQMLDSTGNGYDATSSGIMTSADSVSTNIGNGLEFDGADDYITTSSGISTAIGSGDFTVQMWIKTSDAGTNVFGDNYTSGTDNYWIGVVGGKANFNDSGNISSTTTVSDGVQHLVAFTRSGTTVAVNVDGSEEKTTTTSGNFNGDFVFGKFTVAGGFEFPGTMDEIKVSATFRSANWIATEYDNQNASTAWGTVGAWASGGTTTITASGTLASQASTMSGTATVGTVVTASGSLVSQGATLSGTSTIVKTVSGALVSQSSTMSGTAEITKTVSGALVSQDSTMGGSATVGNAIVSSGSLVSQSSTMTGTAVINRTASGTLVSQASTMSGTVEIVKIASGALVSQSSTMSGVASIPITITSSGVLSSQSATMSGSSTAGTDFITGTGQLILGYDNQYYTTVL